MAKESCHQLLESLSDYLDGDLDPALCEELERHMATCEDCRIVVNTLRKTIELYRKTRPDPDVPAEVRERLYVRLKLDAFLKKD